MSCRDCRYFDAPPKGSRLGDYAMRNCLFPVEGFVFPVAPDSWFSHPKVEWPPKIPEYRLTCGAYGENCQAFDKRETKS